MSNILEVQIQIYLYSSYVTQYHLLIFIDLRWCLYHILNTCVYVDLFVFLYLTLLISLPISVPITHCFNYWNLKYFCKSGTASSSLLSFFQFSNQLLLIFFPFELQIPLPSSTQCPPPKTNKPKKDGLFLLGLHYFTKQLRENGQL